MSENVIYSINGPVVTVKDAVDFSMLEMVYVGNKRLMGEVISIKKSATTIQVYESTTGLKPGEPVYPTGSPISVTLGPGILRNIFDGIERPLKEIAKESGAFIVTGSDVPPLDEDVLWKTSVCVKVGDELKGGQIYARVPETDLIEHRLMVPPKLSGTVVAVEPDGEYKLHDCIVKLQDAKGEVHELTLCQKWPIKQARPVKERLPISVPLITGQRVIDTLFPIAKGGTAAVPGGFGTGKTMTQHQLAKWCDADIIVYVGCGERGNEMTQVLEEFSELIDPKSNKPLTERTVLIANTSNMPVAAREASIYTGITLAEYYRDMGYHVAIMADSTSRWAEALREISGRLEEMPAEEGFPAYLPSRISQFYERAGYMETLSDGIGSVTIIGAVSPQGGDFSEPVTQNTKRFVRCFWALDKALAYARHYFAINWNQSYSEYVTDLEKWYNKNIDVRFLRDRQQLTALLAEETKLMEIVKLIGSDVLPDDQKLVIEISKVIRVGYLQQNAFHKDDTYVPLIKQLKMMDVILHLYKRAKEVVVSGKALSSVLELGLFEKVTKMKYDVPNDHLEILDSYFSMIDEAIDQVQ
ncbi:MAG: V-type ATP synthase subunit A [Erysipelotrichaceae bacterium]|uniref:V-type ATP synthase alpha chain n=1 Tax=Copranaerobaculum intestinale TaxID=2692629 RepID=A0A6N8U9B7_9FIRM|nr:V-type ATP synthase subunit A [Erysipelotrichaceae bacterium]MXQ73323.1 V-type ATP synthase subunit A [Copranaerobaculum intestinale]